MICPKCKIDLPEDSEFCQYCGEKISSPANTVPKQSAPMPPREIPSPKKTKLKFCSQCGNQIDHETKVCTGCGKKYFNWAKIVNTKVLTISIITVLSVLLVISFISNVNQSIRLDEYADELRFYQKYFVIVSNDGTNKYHSHDCPRLGGSTWWGYTKKNAQNKGYKPCSYCYPFDRVTQD